MSKKYLAIESDDAFIKDYKSEEDENNEGSNM